MTFWMKKGMWIQLATFPSKDSTSSTHSWSYTGCLVTKCSERCVYVPVCPCSLWGQLHAICRAVAVIIHDLGKAEVSDLYLPASCAVNQQDVTWCRHREHSDKFSCHKQMSVMWIPSVLQGIKFSFKWNFETAKWQAKTSWVYQAWGRSGWWVAESGWGTWGRWQSAWQ